MLKRFQSLFAAMLLLLIAGGPVILPLEAQESDSFELTLPGVALDGSAAGSGTWRSALGEITVYADGQPCMMANLAASSGDVVLRLGLASQPAACRTSGAALSFLDGQHDRLNQTLTLGSETVLDNFIPAPPGTGAMIIVVSETSLSSRTANGVLGEQLGQLSAKVSDVVCTTVDVSRATGDVAIPVGLPGQPRSCSESGVEVRIFNGRGFELAERFTLMPGIKVAFSNLVPAPPSSQPQATTAVPTTTPSVTASPLPTPGIRPPDTGSAGLLE